ncbi:hypothetical protein [Jannaschia donghaensis]|uniref:Secreted protein n=1 Tax=Jannaschia donghaensis TaxID=420998 RepID=A0A0M6YKR2_9RHOB|nr:hypothetical protein [Jannaschia donghaensis]CTQ50520.1 hypothetical protein JDO7802_02544 [Jannaschia donghaensis]
MMRLLLILLLSIGMLLPRASAVLAQVAGLESVVICRGAELVTITFAADGTPVKTEIEEHGPCLASATPNSSAPPTPAWTRLVHTPIPAPACCTAPCNPAHWDGPPPERAPPVPV